MTQDGLKDKHRKAILDILTANPDVQRVVLFGSRAMGTFTTTSDIDIALFGPSLTLQHLGKLNHAIGELTIPQTVDLLIYGQIENKKLIQHIKKHGVVWFDCEQPTPCKTDSNLNPKNSTPPSVQSDNRVTGSDLWIETTIGDQATLQRGFDITKSQQRPGKHPVISSGGLSSYHDSTMVSGPGVVLGRKGVVGSVYYISKDFWPHDTTLWVKDFHGNIPRYVYYFFKSISHIIASMDVGSANPTLNRNHVHPIQILWPANNDIQRKIVSILGTLDDKIELNRRMNRTLEQMAAAIFKSWFIDFDPVHAKANGDPTAGGLPAHIANLFPNTFQDSELGPIPTGWKISPISDNCESVFNGGTPKRNEPTYWEHGTIPWLTSGEVRQAIVISAENMISEEGLKKSSAKWIPKDSTSVALYGATAGQICFIANELTANQAVCSLVPLPNFRYYNYLSLRHYSANMTNLARGSAQQNLSKGIVESMHVIKPSPDILKTFDSNVFSIFSKWIENLQESRTLAQLRDTLLPKLLSGELALPEAESMAKEAGG